MYIAYDIVWAQSIRNLTYQLLIARKSKHFHIDILLNMNGMKRNKPMPILTTDILMPADFKGQQGYATSYGKKMVNSKMYIRGKIVG